MENFIVKVKKDNEEVELPFYAGEGNIGIDIQATSVEYDAKNDCYVYHTGIRLEMPEDVHCFIYPRSSNRKTDAYLANSIGVIDCSYRGELLICYKNRTSYEVRCMLEQWKHMAMMTMGVNFDGNNKVADTVDAMKKNIDNNPFKLPNPMDYKPYDVGSHVAQLIFMKLNKADLTVVNELSETSRGEGAFGSTGK